jgi:Cu/Ag efflux protein CusF
MLKKNAFFIILAALILCNYSFALSATEKASDSVKQSTGVVKSIDSSQKNITIEKKGSDLSFEITETTRVKNGDKEISLSDIKSGNRVTVKYV